MESLRLFSLLLVVLAAVISVDAGVTPFEKQFIPTDPENLGSKGNKFYVAFPQNTVPRDEARKEPDAYIIVSTTEPDMVQFTVITSFGGVKITTYEVRYNQSTRIAFSPDSFYVRNRDQDDRGILVQAEEGKTISVYVVNDEFRSTDGYLALSCDGMTVNHFKRYEYVIFSARQEAKVETQWFSQFLLIPCENETNIRVTPSQQLSGGIIFSEAEFGPGESIPDGAVWNNPSEGVTLLITNADDLTGTLIRSNKPIVVISGHQCGQVPIGQGRCDYLAEQIPPHTTWGYTYLLNPLAYRESGDYYRFATNLDNTVVTITCVDDGGRTPKETCKMTLSKEQGKNWGQYETHTLPCTDHDHNPFIRKYCCLQATNPVLVAQYSYGYKTDSQCTASEIADPFMSIVPPVTQYLNNYTVTLIDAVAGTFPRRYIGVVVHQSFFFPRKIMIDDVPLEPNATAWQGIYCADGNICGYAISKAIDDGNHTIYHSMENGAINVHMYGFEWQNSYGFPAGMELEAITVSRFCDSEPSEYGLMWPETEVNDSVAVPCDGGNATRMCSPDARWLVPDKTQCTEGPTSNYCVHGGGWDIADYYDCILQQFEDNITREDLDEISEVAAAVQEVEQTESNAVIVRNVVLTTAAFALQDLLIVDEETVSNVVDIINGLQEWPEEVIRANDTGTQIVQSFEVIALELAQQENFTEFTVVNENTAVRIERVDLSGITTGRSLAVSEGNGSLNVTLGSESGLAADQIASGFLPLSLISNCGGVVTVPVIFAVQRTGSLFSVDEGQESTSGLVTSVGSPVVSLTVGVNETFTNLPDPVIVNVRILVKNFTNPRCVSYDFNQQAWVTDGCTTILTADRNQITCECNHLTNFASLVDICSRTEEGGCDQNDEAELALEIISICGVILSGVGLILTIITLLIFPKLRSRDASKFHVQLSLALLGMLLVFVVGIDRTEVFEGCVTVSVLIHYFTLVAVMWMGAEALLIFRKLVIVFVHITTRFIIIISLICWLVPIVPAVIPAIIDPHFMITNTDSNHFCFIGDVRVFFGAFFGPIFSILLFNVVIFILVIGVLVKHNRNKVGETADIKNQKKSNIRLAISLFGIMILFGLTWVLAAFTIREASLAFQILFAVFNSLQGFFIFIFFCVLSSDVRWLWLKMVTCGRYGKTSSHSTSSKGYSTGQRKSGVCKSHKTASFGLSSHVYSASNSEIEFSEYPSSTVLATVSKPPRCVYQPPTSSCNFFKESNAMEERAGDAITQSGYENTEMSITFS